MEPESVLLSAADFDALTKRLDQPSEYKPKLAALLWRSEPDRIGDAIGRAVAESIDDAIRHCRSLRFLRPTRTQFTPGEWPVE